MHRSNKKKLYIHCTYTGVERVGYGDCRRVVKKLVIVGCLALFLFFIQGVICFEFFKNIVANCLTSGWMWVFLNFLKNLEFFINRLEYSTKFLSVSSGLSSFLLESEVQFHKIFVADWFPVILK